jgi:eukaryotic-like serine/threonine-protein kinase
MQPTDTHDTLRTSDCDPNAPPPATDPTGELAQRSAPADGGTVAFLPGTEYTESASERVQAVVSVPGYEILGELGRGGMGVVYKARHIALRRTVALKMILGGCHAGDAHLERLRTEAESIARLQHANIVQIHEVGEHDGLPFLSLEFCAGGSLDRKLVGTPHPEADAAALVEKLAHAMQTAHDKGVIHRDLKPANVLLTEDGTPKITDFGLAKKVDEASKTQSGMIVGTPSYMAPEQASGKGKELGPACDIYALGAILYELVTGRPPFKAATPLDTVMQVVNDEPVPPSRLQSKTAKDLETICLKCLQKEPAKRYASAQALAEDLRRFQANEPIQARPLGNIERTIKWVKRRPMVAGLMATIVVLAFIGFVGISSGLGWALVERENAIDQEKKTADALTETKKAQQKAEEEKTSADQARREAEVAEHEARAAKDNALSKLWDSYLQQARGLRATRRPGQRFASLRAVQAALALPVPAGRSKDELRTEAIAALLLPDFEVIQEWDGMPPGSEGFGIDRTMQRYARGDLDGNVSVRQVKGDVELWKLPGTGRLLSYYGLDFSPDGRFLHHGCLTPQGHHMRVWKLDGAKPAVVLEGNYHGYAFSPDSRQFAAIYPDNSLRVFDLETSNELKRFQPPKAAYHLRWNPRKPLLAVGQGTGYWIVNIETGERQTGAAPEGVTWLDWHPEGRILAVASVAKKALPALTLFDIATGEPALAPFEGHKTSGLQMRFSHAGDRLLSTDWNGIWRLWDTRTGQMLLKLPGSETCLQFSPTDDQVGAGLSQSKVKLFRFQAGRELHTIVERGKAGSGDYQDWAICPLDPTGRLIAVSTRSGMAVVDVVRGEEVALLPLRSLPVHAEPTGALLTNGLAGVMRWPVTVDAKTGVRRYGPPEKLSKIASSAFDAGSSTDGRTVSIPTGKGARVLVLEENRVIQVGPQEDVRHTAVSPDGRWIVTGSHGARRGPGAIVWDAKTGKEVQKLPVAGFCCLRFSPDNKWLLTTGGGYRLWSVGDWKEGPAGGAPAASTGLKAGAFSVDGSLLALQDIPGVIRIITPASGNEVARLTVPEPSILRPYCFTADGTRLVCVDIEREALQIFDLRRIRDQLVKLDLDWDAPPYPAPQPGLPEPLKVEVVGSDMSAVQLNTEAWGLVTGPVDQRNPARALQLVQEAVKQQPANSLFLNTLGVVLYRQGKYADAVTTLDKSLAASKGQYDGFDLYFLAMCHAKLGDADKAKDHFDRAVTWCDNRKNLSAQYLTELRAFRTEAEAVLGLK